MGMSSVVWRPRKNKTSAGKGNHRPAHKRIQAYEIYASRQADRSPNLPTSTSKNGRTTMNRRPHDPAFLSTSDRHPEQINKNRSGSSYNKRRNKGRDVTNARTNTDNKGCRLLAAGKYDTRDPPLRKKVEQGWRGPATSAEEQPRDDWHHKGCGRDHYLQKLLPSHAS